MTILFRTVLAFLGLKLGILTVNALTFPVLARRTSPRQTGRTVSLLVPMRNEAHRLADTLPSIVAQSVDELILLDDCSTDNTAELARQLIADHGNARVIDGTPSPSGWAGKTWACSQLAQHAASQVFVFCDADVLLSVGAIGEIIAQLELQHADLLSVFPKQQTATLGEHVTVPLVDDVLLSFLPFPLLRVDVPAAATANGSVLAIDRLAYEVVGGFEAVRGEVVEDIALARLIRRSGLQLGLVLGGDVVQTRMYSNYRACVVGFGRGLLTLSGGRRWPLILSAGWQLVVYALPVVLCWRRRRWAIPLLLAVLERLVVEGKTGRRQWWQAALSPLSPLAAVPVLVQAARPTQHWKGRSYTVGSDSSTATRGDAGTRGTGWQRRRRRVPVR
jgi:cellulose synthase/poly-beta-1,6-N-acetylglucosamine synthase-like glycosyltransferase